MVLCYFLNLGRLCFLYLFFFQVSFNSDLFFVYLLLCLDLHSWEELRFFLFIYFFNFMFTHHFIDFYHWNFRFQFNFLFISWNKLFLALLWCFWVFFFSLCWYLWLLKYLEIDILRFSFIFADYLFEIVNFNFWFCLLADSESDHILAFSTEHFFIF